MKLHDVFSLFESIGRCKNNNISLLVAFALIVISFFYEKNELFSMLSGYKTLEPALDINALDKVSTNLIRSVNGESIVVWRVNFRKNILESIYVKSEHHRLPFLEGMGDSIFHKEGSNMVISGILNHGAICYKIDDGLPLDRKVFGSKIKYVCSSAIPPHHGEINGILSVGFSFEIQKKDFARSKIKEVAKKM